MVEWRIDKMRGFANQMAARFGHPVWLVGSALAEEKPRDIDLRIVLPDDEFEARYGLTWKEYLRAWSEWPDAYCRLGEDVAKLSRSAASTFRDNVDLQVWPRTAAYACGHLADDKPRLRLDTLELDGVER